MSGKIVIQLEDGTVKIEDDIYEKLKRMSRLLGWSTEKNTWISGFYFLIHLYNTIDKRIPFVIKDNYNFFNEDEIQLIKKLHFEIRNILDNFTENRDAVDLSIVNEITNKFMSLYDTINNFFEFRLFAHRRTILLENLQKCLDEKEFIKCREGLINAGNNIEILKKVVIECEKIIIEDWRRKLTKPNEYQDGENFAFVCHAGVAVSSGFVSASLITNKIFATYCGAEILWILDPSSIFNTSPSDTYIINRCPDPMLAVSDALFSICTKETLEEKTLENQEHCGRNNWNEVDLYEFNPMGILIIIDENMTEDYKRRLYESAKENRKNYVDLPIVCVNKSFYNQRILKKHN